MKPSIYVPDYYPYVVPWLKLFQLQADWEDADVVLLTGGADISPALYGQRKGALTYTNVHRDQREKELFDHASKAGKKFLGICRGAQFLCAMAGGKLAQHIEGHQQGFSGKHRITTSEGRDDFVVNSVHHQMMMPTGDDEILAWAEGLSGVYLDGENKEIEDIEVEPEVVYFPQIQGLGIQCHPEAMIGPISGAAYKPAMDYFYKLVQERLM